MTKENLKDTLDQLQLFMGRFMGRSLEALEQIAAYFSRPVPEQYDYWKKAPKK